DGIRDRNVTGVQTCASDLGAGAVGVDVGEGQIGEVGVVGGGLGELLLDVLDELICLVRLSQSLSDEFDLLVPVGAPRQVGVGDGRGDVGEDVVLLLGDTGPGGEDDVGGQFDDRLEVDVVLTGELGGQFLARLGDGLVDPGQVSGVVAAPLVAL